MAKRQVEQLAERAATDVGDFYASREHTEVAESDVLVISADGKGIVMRPEGLRPATAKAAAASKNKLGARLSKGEKRNRKRLAEVGAVYDVTPVARSAADVLAPKEGDDERRPAPEAANKWLTASVVDDAGEVLGQVFDEAERRDPGHRRQWVALVDGNVHQIEVIEQQAKARKVDIAVVCDFVHVLEHIWAAAWCFFDEGDPIAEAWVRSRATSVLEGKARAVAEGILRRASSERLSKRKRKNADERAKYLANKAGYLDYPKALAAGWPIATGVIEGACRYLVADRMDITGARWSPEGAEAVLRLRTVRANGDFEDYWAFHLRRERQRVHESRYLNGLIPAAA